MITLKDFMEAIQYKVTDGSKYEWHCYGPDAYSMDYWNGLHDDGGVSVTCVFDTGDQTVYEMQAWDYGTKRYYRWINPDYIDEVAAESEERGVSFENAIDDINFIDLDVADDILEKASAMVAGEEYDTRVQISIVIDDDLLFSAMKFAHEADITLNEYIEEILRLEIARVAAMGA